MGAARIITSDSLAKVWEGRSVFLNPPGGKVGNKSQAALFFWKLVEAVNIGAISHAVYVGFSLEQMQTTQVGGGPSIGSFPICIPEKRIRYDLAGGTPGPSPTHSSVIVYVYRDIDKRDKFYNAFNDLGVVINLASDFRHR